MAEPTIDPALLKSIVAEVQAGLPGAKPHLDRALENQAFYDREGERYLPQREAESTFDFMGRPKRQSGLLHQAVEVLTQHLYAPGPSRQFDDPAGAEFLQRVWTDNLYDGLLRRADALATLNDVCAIQVDAGKGDFARRPLTLQMWGREEFHAWTDPDDVTCPVAVVTIDRYDMQTRYRLWTDTELRTYLTKKAGGTSGAIVADPVGPPVPHEYGCLPFGFVHYDLPVRNFYTQGPGTYLRKAEVSVDKRLSFIDESIDKHLNPLPVAENVPPEWNPIIEPQRFIRLFSAGPAIDNTGGFQNDSARLYYLQAWIDIVGAWNDIENYMDQAFSAVGIPKASIRMESFRVASGIALIAEQAPLLSRARLRRGIFQHFEAQLARTILTCAGNHYGKPELLGAADKGMLSLGWAEPTIPVPGPDRDLNDQNALMMGIKSRLMIIQERYGCTRDQAVEILQQIAKDRLQEESILPTAPAPGSDAVQTKDDATTGAETITDTEGDNA